MSFRSIVEELDAQIRRLQDARELIIAAEGSQETLPVATAVTRGRRPRAIVEAAPIRPRRTVSDAVRKRIAASAKKRWADKRAAAAKKAAKTV
jgi:hypothetical protein